MERMLWHWQLMPTWSQADQGFCFSLSTPWATAVSSRRPCHRYRHYLGRRGLYYTARSPPELGLPLVLPHPRLTCQPPRAYAHLPFRRSHALRLARLYNLPRRALGLRSSWYHLYGGRLPRPILGAVHGMPQIDRQTGHPPYRLQYSHPYYTLYTLFPPLRSKVEAVACTVRLYHPRLSHHPLRDAYPPSFSSRVTRPLFSSSHLPFSFARCWRTR